MTKDFLPASFPEGTRFFDVEGVPVSIGPGRANCRAWGPGDAGRRFPADAPERGWPPISEAEFRDLAARLDASVPPVLLLPMKPSFLPASFPEGTTFFDVEGVAVSLRPDGRDATAWAPGTPGRRFPSDAAERGWPPLSEAEFRALASRLAQT